MSNALPAIMLVAYRNWSERPAGLRPRAWLLSLLIDQVRSDGSELMASHADDKVVDYAPDVHIGEPFTLLARRAIREMRAEDREVLALCDVAELGYREAGMVLGLSRSEVKRRLHSARERLQTRLDADSYSS